MNKALKVLYAMVSGGIAAALTLAVGTIAPILIMDWVYGSKQVEDSPGDGGAIVIASFPLTCVLAIAAFAVVTRLMYRRLAV